jgi:hypothetical protein
MPPFIAAGRLLPVIVAASLPALLASTTQATAQSRSVGFMLRPGMQLSYASDGVESPPWIIDSIGTFSTSISPTCVRIHLRTNPSQTVPETRAHCSDSATMYQWDERTGTPRPARPLRSGMTLEVRQANGLLARFETGTMDVERVPVRLGTTATSMTPLEVLPTIVTTIDSAGRAVRRLRERFATGLATATGGVFEVPDSTQPGGWRVARRFELVAIRLP